jgi:hypothetical protein
LPNFEFPATRRFTGVWIVEANTDTELGFETKGLQPLDALHAPPVEGYTPRHRVPADVWQRIDPKDFLPS